MIEKLQIKRDKYYRHIDRQIQKNRDNRETLWPSRYFYICHTITPCTNRCGVLGGGGRGVKGERRNIAH